MLDACRFVLFVYFSVAVLYIVTPAKSWKGYALNASGKPFNYKVHSLRVHLLAVAGYFGLTYLGFFSPTFVYDNYGSCAIAAFAFGAFLSVLLYLKGNWDNHVSAPKVTDHIKEAKTKKINPNSTSERAFMFFMGYELNPRIGSGPYHLDIKMYLYLAGAVMVHIILIAAGIKHTQLFGSLTGPLFVYLIEMTWFLMDYEYNDHVHLYTYDLVDENVGFKLTWGSLFFYPFFYPIGIFPLVEQDPASGVGSAWLVASLALYSVGAFITRGANLQKYYFKVTPGQPFLGIKPVAIGGKILASGWWGLARHFNYFGEIIQALGLALTVGTQSVLPWLYVVYYIFLLPPRERDDNERCSKKYGALWDEYCKMVYY